jgi:hypothetical protein
MKIATQLKARLRTSLAEAEPEFADTHFINPPLNCRLQSGSIVRWFLLLLVCGESARGQGNIVQNGNFLGGFTDWSGNMIAIALYPNAPNGVFALSKDAGQDLHTVLGQQYLLTFSTAADLYFGPTLDLAVSVNSQPSVMFDTPPYAYNAQINRYDQMRWQQFTLPFTASASSTRLDFIDQNSPDFGLAAVSVIAVPEPNCAGILLTFLVVVAFHRCHQEWRRKLELHMGTKRNRASITRAIFSGKSFPL